jgi:hypothetical protein
MAAKYTIQREDVDELNKAIREGVELGYQQ